MSLKNVKILSIHFDIKKFGQGIEQIGFILLKCEGMNIKSKGFPDKNRGRSRKGLEELKKTDDNSFLEERASLKSPDS